MEGNKGTQKGDACEAPPQDDRPKLFSSEINKEMQISIGVAEEVSLQKRFQTVTLKWTLCARVCLEHVPGGFAMRESTENGISGIK